jgi:hypothetical protein
MWWLISVIPTTQEVKIGKMTVQGQPHQKVNKTPFQLISWAWWYLSVIPAS